MASAPVLHADVGNHRIDDEAIVASYFAMLTQMCDDAATATK